MRVEVDCPGPTADFATVKVNGAALPLASLTLEIRAGEVNRVVMELQPEDVEIAVEAVPLLRRALDPSLVDPAPEESGVA